jgi:hypothetical protein
MRKPKEEKYFDTQWTPPGYTEKEWQIIWRKLWLLSKDELKNLTEKMGTSFINKKIQEKDATKSNFILLIDDGVDKNELIGELDKILINKGFFLDTKKSSRWLINYLNAILKEKGVR